MARTAKTLTRSKNEKLTASTGDGPTDPGTKVKKSTATSSKRHPASVARDAFKDFSLSRYAGAQSPRNYVHAGEDPQATSRATFERQVGDLGNDLIKSQFVKISIPEALLQKLVPSLKEGHDAIDPGQVVTLLRTQLRGTEFFARGNPTLNRAKLKSQVNAIIAGIKSKGENQ